MAACVSHYYTNEKTSCIARASSQNSAYKQDRQTGQSTSICSSVPAARSFVSRLFLGVERGLLRGILWKGLVATVCRCDNPVSTSSFLVCSTSTADHLKLLQRKKGLRMCLVHNEFIDAAATEIGSFGLCASQAKPYLFHASEHPVKHHTPEQ